MSDEKGPGVGAPEPGRKHNVDAADCSAGRRDLPPNSAVRLHLVPPPARKPIECPAKPAIWVDPIGRRVWLEAIEIVGLDRAERLPSGDVLMVDDAGDVVGPLKPAFSLFRGWPYRGMGVIVSGKRHARLALTVEEVRAATRWWDGATIWPERRRVRASWRAA